MQRRQWLLGALALPARGRSELAPTDAALEWVDARRGRRLPLRVRWPDGEARCAAVLYSHGLGGSRDGGDAWGRAWRDAGIAVLHLQHPGSDAELLRGGLAALRAGATADQLLARVADVRFVLDELQRRAADWPWSRIEPARIGLAGHSFGAVTTQALAGQHYPIGPSLAEPRLAAFAALSPSPPRVLSPAQAFGGVTRPFLCVAGSVDGDPFGSFATGEPRARVFGGLPSGQGRRALLWLRGADHMSLAGNAQVPIRWAGASGLRDPATLADEPRHHRLVAHVTTLWWRDWLADDHTAATLLREVPAMLGPGDRWDFD